MSIVGKKKVAQQLVEFLLVVPFMVIILGILTEYAYALNINLTIAQAIKTATSAGYMAKDDAGVDHYFGTYSQIGPQADKAASQKFIVDKVTAGFIQYLKDNNVPTKIENNISVKPLTVGSTTIFVAGYTYIPAFTLPNVFFRILPDKFDFSAASTVPSAFLGDNSAYVGGYDTNDLNRIWASSGDLANIDSFDSGKKGAINGDYLPGNENDIVFLSYFPLLNGSSIEVRPSPLGQPYSLSGRDGVAVDMANGLFYWWEYRTETRYYASSDAEGNVIMVPYEYTYIQTGVISPFAREIENYPYYQVMFNPIELSLGGTSNYDGINASGYEIRHYGSIKIVRPTTVGVNIGVIAPNPKPAGYNFDN